MSKFRGVGKRKKGYLYLILETIITQLYNQNKKIHM
jgi:hypothetical protein